MAEERAVAFERTGIDAEQGRSKAGIGQMEFQALDQPLQAVAMLGRKTFESVKSQSSTREQSLHPSMITTTHHAVIATLDFGFGQGPAVQAYPISQSLSHL